MKCKNPECARDIELDFVTIRTTPPPVPVSREAIEVSFHCPHCHVQHYALIDCEDLQTDLATAAAEIPRDVVLDGEEKEE